MTTVTFDPNDLTFGDMEDFESIVGVPFEVALAAKPTLDPETGEFQRDNRGRLVTKVQPSPKAMVALIYIGVRRTDPTFTVDDARKMKVSELQVANVKEADPK